MLYANEGSKEREGMRYGLLLYYIGFCPPRGVSRLFSLRFNLIAILQVNDNTFRLRMRYQKRPRLIPQIPAKM